MVIPVTRTTGPLTTRMAAREEAHGWRIADHEDADGGAAAVLASYSCDCNRLTLAQITRRDDLTAQFSIVAPCPRDGTLNERPYRLTPWAIDDFAMRQWDWNCTKCNEPVAEIRLVDGIVVGLKVVCPICGILHNIDLSLSAIPAEMRLRAFGIVAPRPILSPPVMNLLRDMWSCVRDAPESNSFVYVAHTMRYDSGRVIHRSSQSALNTEADYLEQLACAGLIEDGDHISISDLGIDRCRHEFGAASI